MEAIHADARICPVCLSRQRHSVFASVGKFIKWVGGIAAVTSLIIGIWQVNSPFVSWTEKRQAIEELVLARENQVLLAMKRLRNIINTAKEKSTFFSNLV